MVPWNHFPQAVVKRTWLKVLKIHNLPPNNYDTLPSQGYAKPSLFAFYAVNRNTTLKVAALKES